jgi:GABA permease
MVGILVAMAFIPEQQTPLLFGLISFGLLLVGYALRARFGSNRS